MNAEAVFAVSAAVSTLVQYVKWSGMIPDKWGPVAVAVLALIGVAIWGISQGEFMQRSLFEYFVGWITVMTSSAGFFGFVRAVNPSNVTATHSPPPGPAQYPTGKL